MLTPYACARAMGPRRYCPHTPLLTLLLLLLCCTVGCLAASHQRCMHDKISELNKPVTVVRELPRKGEGAVQAYTANAASNSDDSKDNENWVPIRIKAYTRDLNDPSKYCTKAGDIRVDQTYTTVYCRANGVLTVRKKRIIEEQLIPEAIKMHTERIFVVREKGIVKVPSMEHTYCSHYTIPEEHHTIGLQDAELYFYVSALQTDRAMAWGAYCACADDGRPIVGSLNLNPTYVEATDAAIRTVAHEIAHLLGFDYFMFLKLGIVDIRVALRQREVTVINTTQSRKVASEHYGCPTATGVELESTTSCGTARSHLEFRNAKDELMAPSSKASYYTKLTLGIFESMPFYKVNYSMAEPMKWGNNSGCDFLEKKCLTGGETAYPDMFCNQHRKQVPFLCTHDFLAIGYCTITWYSTPLPDEYQYFLGKHFGGTSREMDYCPYVQEMKDSSCTTSTTIQRHGSFVGPKSRCVKGENLKFTTQPIGDVCVNTNCENGTLSVQFRLDEEWYKCEKKGERVRSKNGNWSGSIICPAYEEVCTEHRNVTIVLKELPPQADDDQPAPKNITWPIKPKDPSTLPHPPPEPTMETVGAPHVERERTSSHPNVPTNSLGHHTSGRDGLFGTTTYNVPTTSATVEEHMELADLHIHYDNAALDTREAQSQDVQGNHGGAVSPSHPARAGRKKMDKGQKAPLSHGGSTQSATTNNNMMQDSVTMNNLDTNGKVRGAHALNNSDAIALNIGIGDGSVTAAGHPSLLLLILVSAVTVGVSL